MRNTIINRRFKYTDVNATAILIIINVIVFILQNIFAKLPYILSMVPIYIRLRHWYWQFFTYMFSHVDFWHLFSNMLGLYIFGRIVERSVGSREFLLYYLLTGTLAGFASYFFYLYSAKIITPLHLPVVGKVFLTTPGVWAALLLSFRWCSVRKLSRRRCWNRASAKGCDEILPAGSWRAMVVEATTLLPSSGAVVA